MGGGGIHSEKREGLMKAGASGFNPYSSTGNTRGLLLQSSYCPFTLHGVFRIPFEREVDRFDGALCTSSTHSFVGASQPFFYCRSS